MPARLRNFARFLRLALVCLALAWTSAPAASAPGTDAIALVALTPAAAENHAPAAPADRAAPAPGQATLATRGTGQLFADGLAAFQAAGPPRRLYLEHRALLC